MPKTIALTDEQVAALCPQSERSNQVLIRSSGAGVFYGTMVSRDNDVVTLNNARRCWYWAGANTVSELATKGTTKPKECKFPIATTGDHIILNVIEIIPITKEALETLESVAIWKQQ